MLGHLWKDGQDTAMRCVGFQTILIRGVEWATTGRVTYPVPKDFPTASQVGLPARTPDRPVKPQDKSQPKNKSGRSILSVPCLELSLEPPRAFLGHVSRSPSVGLPTQPPGLDQIELGWVFVGRLNRLFDPTGSTNENRMECFGVMSCGRSAIDKNEKLGLRLTLAERKLILEDPIHIHDEIADPFRATPTGFPVLLTLDQLEDLGGHVAAEANHSTDKKLRKRLSPANPAE